MNILIISHKPPYPIIDGGCLAMSRFLENLKDIDIVERITHFSLSTYKHPFDIKSFPEKTLTKFEFLNAKIDIRIKPVDAFINLVTGKSYNLSRFYNKRIAEQLIILCQAKRFDVIIFESLYASVYFKDLKYKTNSKFIYRAHNIENQIWEDQKHSAKGIFRKIYLNQLFRKLKKYEHSFLSEPELILPLSTNDSKIIKSFSTCRTVLLPVTMENQDFELNYGNKKLCFIGSFNWEPNKEAMNWFVQNVFIKLKEKFEFLELHIAGSHSNEISHLNKIDGVQLHGFVESSSDFLSKNDIFISPLLSGSGVKMKVLEAMTIGIPCSLSTKSAEGIPIDFKSNETKEEFIADLCELIENHTLRIYRGMGGKKTIKDYFEKSKINEILANELFKLTSTN